MVLGNQQIFNPVSQEHLQVVSIQTMQCKALRSRQELTF